VLAELSRREVETQADLARAVPGPALGLEQALGDAAA
jgi:hypothetical protein